MRDTGKCVYEEADRLHLPQLDLQAPIEPRPQGCSIPLTAEQRYILNGLMRFDPEQRPITVRVCASATRITGPLSPSLLERSIAGLMHRHESLRTTFKTYKGVATQHIDPPGEYRLSCVDLSTLSKSEAESEARRLSREFQDQRIDLSLGPVFEARLFKLATQEHVLIVLADHMVSDGASNALLDKEIWQAYDDGVGDEPAPIPTPSVQFADYAVWQERTREAWRKEHEDYWKQHLMGAAPSIIPILLEAKECSDSGTVVHIALGPALVAKLRQFASRELVSLSTVMLTVYATAMALWCDKEDLIIRYPVHGHYRQELENVVGFLCNCLYLRVRLRRRCTLQDLVGIVRDEVRNAFEHRDFDRVLDFMPELAKTDLEFHWRSARWRGRAVRKWSRSDQSIKRKPFLTRGPTLPSNLWCIFNETPSDVSVTVCYRKSLFRHGTVQRFERDMRSIAQTLIERPLDPIAHSQYSGRTRDL